jgi:hypothetical protein
MNGVSRTLLATTVLLLPAVTTAQQQNQSRPFSYSYAELAYDESDFDLGGGGDIDGDGFTISGSYEINEDWHAYASYGMADLDFGIDVDTLAIGAGYRYPLQDDLDIYGRVLYINADADVPGPGDADEDGLGLQVRLRFRVSDEFEVEGGIQHLDVGDSDTSLQASARYHFNQNFSAGITLTFAGDTDTFGINGRYSF